MNNIIFMIGDKITDDYGNKGKITGFQQDKFNKTKLIVEFGENYRRHLKDVQHSKQPLFTTEDGYNVYDGDKYYYTTTQGRRSFILRRRTANNSSGKCSKHGVIYFKKKENAEKWIDNNKPRYSKKDIGKTMKIAEKYTYNMEQLRNRFLNELEKDCG